MNRLSKTTTAFFRREFLARFACVSTSPFEEKGYDSDAIRDDFERCGADPVLPTKPNTPCATTWSESSIHRIATGYAFPDALSLATKLIGLSIIQRQAEHVRFGVLINLELDEPVGKRSQVGNDCRKPAERHELRREHFAVPGFEPQPGASCLQLHDKFIAFHYHHRLAYAGM
jgi:hypothetical protein